MMEGTEIPAFGEALAMFRTRAGLSQQRLADQLGKNRRTIAAWEAGDYLPKTKGDVLELSRILVLKDEEATLLLKAAGIDPSLAIWNIPFPRNPFFTGRTQELQQIHAHFQQAIPAVVGKTLSISGLGGIGKTQLAIEYAYRYSSEYHYILWARATGTEALNSSYSELAHLLNLPEKEAEDQNIVTQAVKRWLQRQHGWLLTLDNADSPALLSAFLPPTIGGHLLLTTRAAEVSAHLPGFAHPLVVNTFSEEQGALLLLYRSGLLPLDSALNQAEGLTQQHAMEIAHDLGELPLALNQAGAYLAATRCSLADYQQIYRQHRSPLFNERRNADYPETLATTWSLSFTRVEQQNPAAADLLRLFAVLAPDAIPEIIITEGASFLGPHLATIGTDAYQLNQSIEALRAYSLISREISGESEHLLSVHRLVQVVVQDAMQEQNKQEWARRAIQAINAVFPSEKHQNWLRCELLLPHVLLGGDFITKHEMVFSEAGQVFHKAGYYLFERARYQEAEPLYQRALAILEQAVGPEHPEIGSIQGNLARLYRAQGRLQEAEERYQRALEFLEKVLGPEHSETNTIRANLARLYHMQGRLQEAEELYQHVVNNLEESLGPEHPEISALLGNLAELYRAQGRYAEAESLYLRALTIQEKVLKPEHHYIGITLNNLAQLYETQGRYEEAESLYQRALAILEKVLGTDHPEIGATLNNLAKLYSAQGRYEEAEPLYQRALALLEKVSGPEHLNTSILLGNLAKLYSAQGRYEEAEPLYQRALAIQQRVFESEHPFVGMTLNGLAELYSAQSRYEEAEPLYQRALAILEKVSGTDHPDTARIFENYVKFLLQMNRIEEAAQLKVNYQKRHTVEQQ